MLLFYILFIIFLLFTSFYTIIQYTTNISHFSNQKPKERLPDLIKEFGNPDIINNQENGIAIWYNRKIYYRIELRDESIKHCKPAQHYDFLYSVIGVYIPFNKVIEIMRISDSIMYDQLKRELIVRCHFTGANIATIYLCLQVALNRLSVLDIETRDLYKTTIMNTVDNKAYRDKLEGEIATMRDILNSKAPQRDVC